MSKILLLLFLGGCGVGFKTGEGSYTGKLVDVTWTGIFSKSCEIRQQTGMGSEHNDVCSSIDRVLCDNLEQKMGQEITISYSHRFMHSPFTMDSNCMIENLVGQK